MKNNRREETVSIERMTSSGEGMAEVGGERLRIAGALVGEEVRAELDARGRGVVKEVRRAHPERVAAVCPVIDRCGGCDWMHASSTLQRELHAEMVGAELGRRGIEAPISVEPVGEPLGYRDRARLLVRAHGRAEIGYRRARSHRLVAIESCPVLSQRLAPVLAQLARTLEGSRGEGEAQVALGRTPDGLASPVVELTFSGELAGAVFARVAELVDAGRWAGARLWEGAARVPASFGDPRPVVEAGDGRPLILAPGGFGQPSEAAGIALSRHVARRLDEAQPKRVVELFAGSGTLTVLAAARALDSYLAVEREEQAVAALRDNVQERGLEVRCVVADAERYRIREADLVLLDPPRLGAAGAMEAVVAARVRRLLYVSCNPTTMARDLAALGARYRVKDVTLFDIFPQTSHVEAVAEVLRR